MKKTKGFSIAEILILFLMISVFMAMTLPIMTVRKKESGGVQKNVMSLISNQTLIDAIDISGDGFTSSKLTALKAAYPAAIAIEEMTWGDTAAINTLKYYLESTDSTATQKTNAKKVMKALCDLGNTRACLYFVTKCAFNNECDVADSDVDLNYYLTKVPASSTNGGLAQITKYGKIFYAHYSKLITAVDNTCCVDSSLNEACAIKGTKECAASTEGVAYCWGFNNMGELGNNSTTDSLIPTAVTMPTGKSFSSVAAGTDYTCAVTTDELGYCWGYGLSAQLGNGSTTTSLTPVAVTMPSSRTFLSISASPVNGSHNCARARNGSTYGYGYCWGDNSYGQLGTGNTTAKTVPTYIANWNYVSVGQYHTCVANAGTTGAGCWGYNYYGQLGNNSTTNSTSKVTVSGLSSYEIISIAAGMSHSCAVTSSGYAYCWGLNAHGQLGDNTNVNKTVATPVTMPSGKTFTSIVAGDGHTCALTTDGLIYCWGYGTYGQIGNGSTSDKYVPTAAIIGTDKVFSSLSVGRNHNCAVTTDGLAYCWGHNGYGQLGNNGTTNKSVPTLVTMPADKTFTSISAGYRHTCAE